MQKEQRKITMKTTFLVTLATLSTVLAAPQSQHEPAQILRHESNISPDGYQFVYETSDGTARQEQGQLKQIDETNQALEVTGNYRYIAPDGVVYSVTFTANEHGFQPRESVGHEGGVRETQYQQ